MLGATRHGRAGLGDTAGRGLHARDECPGGTRVWLGWHGQSPVYKGKYVEYTNLANKGEAFRRLMVRLSPN